MDLLPPICCSCRHGLVIPALVAESQRAVFWCRREIAAPPVRDAFLGHERDAFLGHERDPGLGHERETCPGYERETSREEERLRTRA